MTTKTKPIMYIAEPEEVPVKALERISALVALVEGDEGVEVNYTPQIEGLMIRNRTIVDRKLLERLPRLRWVLRIGTGLDQINIPLLKQKGIELIHAPGVNSGAVAEYVVGMMVAVSRKWFAIGSQDILAWRRTAFMGRELRQKTIGIIGFGEIGKQVYKRLMLWECKEFRVFDPLIEQEELFRLGITPVQDVREVVKQADIITLHVPLTRHTQHLINHELMAAMKPGVLLINTARGAVVDEEALLTWMPKKQGQYVADVFEHEPMVRKALLAAEFVTATPHIAAMTHESQQAMIDAVLEQFMTHYYPPKGSYAVNQPGV
jgi:hydroxypyruvate reductase